jgi:hypothetical protein
MKRFNLELLLLKTVYILYRKYMILSWSEPRYSYSRTACMEEAWKILQHPSVIHAETKPEGLLHEDKWLSSALSSHDFLLAAMILCLDIDHRRRSREQTPLDSIFLREDALLQALEESHEIWPESSGLSAEAMSAHRTLSIMPKKLDPYTSRNEVVSVDDDNNVQDALRSSIPELYKFHCLITTSFNSFEFATSAPVRQHVGLSTQ